LLFLGEGVDEAEATCNTNLTCLCCICVVLLMALFGENTFLLYSYFWICYSYMTENVIRSHCFVYRGACCSVVSHHFSYCCSFCWITLKCWSSKHHVHGIAKVLVCSAF